ncbi:MULTISPECIES: sensor histidine kinase [Streptosporangium]|uniref:histidine kinase n=1 Tax=Streptosporangium brasiliense TaxID=47480 RepID=A0ABT9RJL9_9ACTN|nr:histidine kinase [Streptosporangium brasiliense]MDP9869493.1 signal transduction histidine kinase [Streptosporangium brasiliense]
MPRRADLALAFVVGVPLLSLSVVMAVLSVPGVRAALLVGACLVAHAALAYRREVWAFFLVATAFAVQAAVTGLFLMLPSVAVFPIAVYSCTVYGRRFPPLAAGLAGAGAAAYRFAHDPSVTAAHLGPDPWLLLGLLASMVMATWGFGLYRRTQLAYVALLEEQAEASAARATLAERARIAREMHDVVAHALAVIVAQARGGRFAPERAAEVLATVEETGRRALTEMRGLVGVLRTDTAPLAPSPGLADLSALLSAASVAGPVETGTAGSIGPAAELVAYRVVQEALTNTLKHAGPAATAAVHVDWTPDALVVTVTDDGASCGTADGQGNGLAGMRERMSAVGGTLEAGPREEGGFAVVARLPYRKESM